jgi:YVTN family beta-propeller protein
MAGAVMTMTGTVKATTFAYVQSPLQGFAQVIDVDENRVVSRIAIGEPSGDVGSPFGVALSPDGRRAYVALIDSVAVLDTISNTLAATVPLDPARPTGIAIAADGKRAYVCRGGALFVLDTTTNERVATTGAPGCVDIAMAPAGGRAYVSGSSQIAVLDTTTNEIVGLTGSDLGDLSGIAPTPDGKRIYAVTRDGHILVIDAGTNDVITTLAAGKQNEAIAIAKDGQQAYVTDFQGDRVLVINISNNQITTEIPINSQGPGHPFGIAIAPDGKHAYVTSTNGHVSIIDTTANKQTGVIGGTAPGAGIAIGSIPKP